MKKLLTENWIVMVIGVFLMCSMALALRNNKVILDNHHKQQQAELIRQQTEAILSKTMHGLDLGVRGYTLTGEPAMLRPYEEAIAKNRRIFFQLDSLLEKQAYSKRSELDKVKTQVDNYIAFSRRVVEMANSGMADQAIEMIGQDKGYEVWKEFAAFADPLFIHEAQINQEARGAYQKAMQINLITQVSILVLAIPLLYMFMRQLSKERKARAAQLEKVSDNDRQFVFDPGTRISGSAEEINQASIDNVTKASRFVSALAEGNFSVEWSGLNQNNVRFNRSTLAGNLVQLRDKLSRVKEEDEKRNWINEGIAAFSERVRIHQHDIELMAEQCVIYLAKYVNAQQAGLFLLHEEGDNTHLYLAACYAFNRKKFIQKKISIGEGLIGQTYLEKEVVQLRQIPQGYTHITSGLGEAMPSHMVIVPFKTDTEIPAIIELFSFKEIKGHQIDFLKRAGEVMASAIISSQTTARMRQLLEDSRNLN
jgi:CHASE3 domain sensor protein